MKKGALLYEGKAKKIFAVEGRQDVLWQEFKDIMTAFNGERKEYMPRKGEINLSVMELVFTSLEKQGIRTHLIKRLSLTECLTHRLSMIPLEVVVRNIWAGSSAKKFARPSGEPLKNPLFELYLKNDELNDPFLSAEQALSLEVVSQLEEIYQLKEQALRINEVLRDLFDRAGILLVDFKVEYGRNESGELILGDEISGDSCRLWDKSTGTVLDKDRFRKNMGDVMSSYEEVLRRLQLQGEKS